MLLVIVVAIAGLAAYLVYPNFEAHPIPGNGGGVGTPFAWGPASNVTANASPPAGCVAHLECYDLEIGSAGSGITGNRISFSVRSSTGSVVSTTGWRFTLVDDAGDATTAVWSGSGNCEGSQCSSILQSGEVIAVDTGATASLLGDNIIGIGTGNGFQGEVSSVGGLPR